MTTNPILELLMTAMECSNRLPADAEKMLHDAVNFAAELVELPDWMPEFIGLVDVMIYAAGSPCAVPARSNVA